MPTSEVILVITAAPERTERLLGAAGRLAALTGGARIITFPVPLAEMAAAERVAAGIDVGATIRAQGRRADLIVMARPEADDDVATRQAFRAALFQTERPLLVVPPVGPVDSFGHRVAIAWRDDTRAVKAVLPALRLLAGAQVVQVITGQRPGTIVPGLPAVLAEHEVNATLHPLDLGAEPFGQVLLRETRALEADLLVMGAFAHTQIRELLLGGTTRYVLEHAELPVLMRH
ncbi:Universal stress protein [Rhodovastum atsumiense]|uniref:Universal stress protein n=1 Tax=Rhodovastum atsumiense TaxID=504468 RepID=A0A5M6IKJ5_9PROT|nr:universal stress protein [Rhodovastum atsumiense]KAA5608776.1 universal stress protein [Rhodovastum atsumiense]CAH2602872.1 Universal stress protein [Rhodovastum atsumiense]